MRLTLAFVCALAGVVSPSGEWQTTNNKPARHINTNLMDQSNRRLFP